MLASNSAPKTSSYSFMGRHNSDPAYITGPSIALLQERFRQLEKAKEQRENRTKKLFSQPQAMTPTKNHAPVKKEFTHELIFRSNILESDQDKLFLGLSLNSKHTGFQVRKTQPSWLASIPKCKYQISEVDTSLHHIQISYVSELTKLLLIIAPN